MATLTLDLHPIYNDSARIESALEQLFNEAEEKRIPTIEIIPGKGSGALKKTVLRFLLRPEIKSRYQRVVKDKDNWGRLFVHFRWTNEGPTAKRAPAAPLTYHCFCCDAANALSERQLEAGVLVVECLGCGSPNRVWASMVGGKRILNAESGY